MFHSKSIKLCGLLVIMGFVLGKMYFFLVQDNCLNNGNVWDYKENRCREDCLSWNKINGCIKMTIEQIRLFRECRHKANNCVPRKVFDEICLNNNLPLNKETGECDTEFTIEKCNKLGKNWIYPAICNKQ